MPAPATAAAKPWVPTGPARHQAATLTADQAVDRYTKLVRRFAWRCLRQLPAHSLYTHEDLVQEGMGRMLYALARYKPRRAAFVTYLHFALRNHYNALLRREQQRADITMDPMLVKRSGLLDPHTEVSAVYAKHYHIEDDHLLAVAPPQDQRCMELDMARGQYPCRIPGRKALTIGLRRYVPVAAAI